VLVDWGEFGVVLDHFGVDEDTAKILVLNLAFLLNLLTPGQIIQLLIADPLINKNLPLMKKLGPLPQLILEHLHPIDFLILNFISLMLIDP
jgi:hypothetical protein